MSSTLTTQLTTAEATIQQHSSALRKELGFADLVFAQIVIVMIPDAFGTAAKAGQAHVLYWILGIAIFFLPLTFVHLNRLIPLEGGLYEWARLAFNDRIGFLTDWNVWLFNAFYTGCHFYRRMPQPRPEYRSSHLCYRTGHRFPLHFWHSFHSRPCFAGSR